MYDDCAEKYADCEVKYGDCVGKCDDYEVKYDDCVVMCVYYEVKYDDCEEIARCVFAVIVSDVAAAGAGAFDYHHIQYPFHSYTVRDDDVDAPAAVLVVAGVHVSVVFVVSEFVVAAAAVVVVVTVQRSLNVHWQFQEVSRSSVKARCSGRHVLADEGDGAQRQRSGPVIVVIVVVNDDDVGEG
ncbi:hypothetical protein FF38_01138 [Lucilia cuprina]|uniref:Uncharacterized protein n=1 Tax=Lucilia cuprina TaxID=7375 RepID=A0A0L0C1Y9_LUCCU|nr:hypothetical protein FF38_01138 [Lucilia cuprina]